MSESAERFRWLGKWPRKRAGSLVAAAVAAALGAGTLVVLVDDGGHKRPASAGPVPVNEDEAQRQARESGHPVRVETSLTPTSTTTANPDGSFTWTQHVSPIRTKVDGIWRDIDTTLAPVAGGFAPKATTTKLVFSAGGTSVQSAAPSAHQAPRRLPAAAEPPAPEPSVPAAAASPTIPVETPAPTASTPQAATPSPSSTASSASELADGQAELPPGALLRMTGSEGKSFTLLWPNGPLPQAQVFGDQALYPEVFPGVDLVLTARDGGFSQVLVVKTRDAAANPQVAELAYQLSSAELSFAHDAESGVTRAVDAAGTMVAASPTPFMWDSSGHAPGSHWAEHQAVLAADAASAAAAASASASASGSPSAAPASPAPTAPPTSGTLALPGLGGPEPGTRDAVVAARLDGDKLRLTPDQSLLTGPETVFPVFVDPSFFSHQAGWTLAYKTYPTKSFWMGANFNGGTTTARVGHENDTNGTSQSFFRMSFDPNLLAGATIFSSTFRILETHAWSCQAKPVDLHLTGPISEGTTWANKPAPGVLQQSINAAKGYNASCPGDYLAFNTLDAASRARDGRWGDITFVLKAANEADTYAWKKFAVNPSIEIVYNRPPWPSGAIRTTPGGACRTDASVSIANNDVVISAHNADPDGDLRDVFLRVWNETTGARVYDGWAPLMGNGWFDFRIYHHQLTNGVYAYSMRPHDWSGAWAPDVWAPGGEENPCRFTIDKSAPSAPSVSSAQYPAGNDAAWPEGAEYGTLGTFTFGANGTSDTIEYAYSFDVNNYQGRVRATTPGGTATIKHIPAHAGPVNLYVKAIDDVGNTSRETVYSFFVEPRDQVDGPMDFTGDQKPDLAHVDANGKLRIFPSSSGGRLNQPIDATRTDDGSGNAGVPQVPDDYFKNALTTYHGDIWGADGFQDIVARMPDGKLWVYPGNGRGAIDTAARIELLLPAGAPAPNALTQLLAIGDATGDGKADFLAVAGTDLWAFDGYTGATVLTARKIATGTITNRTIHGAADITGDGGFDLLIRDTATGKLTLRPGVKAGAGIDLASLGTPVRDVEYAASGFPTTAMPQLTAIPDVTADGIPDLWATDNAGVRWLYAGNPTNRNKIGARSNLGGDSMDFCQTYPGATGGTRQLCGPILTKYLDLGGPAVIGLPATDTTGTPDGIGKFAHFRNPGQAVDNASIYWTPTTGAHYIKGGIRDRWSSLGWETSPLGYPTGDEITENGGWSTTFQWGGLYARQGSTPYYVFGDIYLKFAERGGLSFFGWPTTDETATPDGVGRYNHFTTAMSIYWSPASGAHQIGGSIKDRWALLGWEAFLGYPTTDETATPDGIGRFNHFTNNASVYWTPTTGAWAVYGSIRTHWAHLGWETSWLGYPTTNEFDIPGGKRTNFQGGYITWTAATGAVAAYPY
ncbi:hypothetical protein [Yinghuangia sp. YIM S10712]|uniref:hypothetical protein n=1 Tax=Yinghuangia sp. YIM S10712 TaxID=3436930 RepID=UPI003F53D2C3